MRAYIIGIFLVLNVAAEVTEDGAKNIQDPVSGAVKASDPDKFFPEGTQINDTYYRAASLPSMLHKREQKGRVRFRLAIIPSFSKPLFLTYSRGADGASIAITRIRMRWDNNELQPDGVELNGKVNLGDRIAELLEDEAIKPQIRSPLSYLTKDQKQLTQGLDGTSYVIEVSTDKDYTVDCIWTPEAIISEKAILNALSQQQVDIKTIADDLKMLIGFRDHLFDIVGLKEPKYSISALLDNG